MGRKSRAADFGFEIRIIMEKVEENEKRDCFNMIMAYSK